MLESGCVSIKNEANIMMKNVVDVVFGGFTYCKVNLYLIEGINWFNLINFQGSLDLD